MPSPGGYSRVVLVLAVVIAGFAGSAMAQEERVDPDKVDEAVRRGVEWLYDNQNANGLWEEADQPLPAEHPRVDGSPTQSPRAGQWGGRTALAVYALLAAGENPQDEKLKPAVTFVKTADLRGTYAVGLRIMALTRLPADEQVKTVLQRDADLLVQTVKTQGNAAGHFDYNNSYRQAAEIYSHSRSQYGILGLHAAARGARVPEQFWLLADAGWRRNQHVGTGGWEYQHPDDDGSFSDTTPGMTCAGVASLLLAADMIGESRPAACNGNYADASVEAGLAWITQNFELFDPEATYKRDYPYKTLFNLERVGVATGLRYLGSHDWFDSGAKWLIDNQRRDGSWGASGSGTDRLLSGVPDTSFALLFLARGRSPVMANKLAYTLNPQRGQPRLADWNQRPRDLANLARFAGEAVEKELHWFIVDETRNVTDWLESPLLYITGDDPFTPTPELKDKLRAFVHQGGLIVVNVDCGRRPAAEAFREAFEDIFDPYAFRILEKEHALFDMQFPLNAASRVPQVLGLGNGAREFAILVPTSDVGRDWQQGRDETALQLGTNLYLYGVDRNGMQPKGRSWTLASDPEKQPTRSLRVGRVQWDGNWNPEPGGWTRLATLLHNSYDIALGVTPFDAAADPSAANVLHLTGTGELTLDEATSDRLKAFVDSGGLLLVDAAGGDTIFATSAERELQRLFGEAADALQKPLDAGHPIYGEHDGLPALEIAYRLDTVTAKGSAGTGRLLGIERDGRLVVVWSPEDLSVGLVGMPRAGISGYAPETASTLVARLLHGVAEDVE